MAANNDTIKFYEVVTERRGRDEGMDNIYKKRNSLTQGIIGWRREYKI
jgi:hypothetical protein